METLRAMFPDLEQDILQAMLIGHDNDLERTIDALLDTGSRPPPASNAIESAPVNLPPQDLQEAQMAADELEARRLQEMLDQEVAHEVHRELSAAQAAELAAEQERRRANSIEARTASAAKTAASAAASAAKSTKNLFARASSAATGAARPLSARMRAGERSARLLGSVEGDSMNMAPLQASMAPLQAPPGSTVYAPPPVPAQTLSSTRTYAAPEPPVASPLLSGAQPLNATPLSAASPAGGGDSDTPVSAEVQQRRYSSRVERARQANRRLSGGAEPEASPAATQPLSLSDVPVAQLISVD